MGTGRQRIIRSMTTSKTSLYAQFTASIPENYDRYLGPVLFDLYARDIAGRLPKTVRKVLETACGTGIVTRRILETLPSGATLVATDLNAPMVEFARSSVGDDARLDWRAADMGALDFPDASFDAIVCQFGLMFAPDKDLALREARRVLAPGGTLLFNVWDSLERNPFAFLANDVITGFFHSDPPTFYQVPFCMSDRDRLREMLARAGFAKVTDAVVPLESSAPNAQELARGLVQGNPVVNEIQARSASVNEIERKLAERIREELGDHPVPVRLQAIVFEAR